MDDPALRAQPNDSTPSPVDAVATNARQQFLNAAQGYGRAVGDGLLPGEPYMSMQDAADVHAQLARAALSATDQGKGA